MTTDVPRAVDPTGRNTRPVLQDGDSPQMVESERTDGSIMSARPLPHLPLSARKRPSTLVASVGEVGNREATKSNFFEALGPLEAAHLVFLDGQRRKHVVGLRHETDAGRHQHVGPLVRDVLPTLQLDRAPTFTRPKHAFSSVDCCRAVRPG